MSESRNNKPSHFEKLPQWLVPGAGVIYATGFLIVFTFMERFSMRETGDFFKVKYIHAGITYWLFLAIVLVPAYGIFLLWRAGVKERKALVAGLKEERKIALSEINETDEKLREEQRKRIVEDFDCRIAKTKSEPPQSFKIYVPSAILILNLLLVFYVFAVFAPPGFATNQRKHAIPVIFAVTLLGVILIRLATKGLSVSVWNYARWVLCLIVVIGLDSYALHGLFGLLWLLLWRGAGYFLVFIFLIPVIIERTRLRLRETQDRRMRTALRVVISCIIFALYYLSVLAFALRVYPYIPVLKGGGDYVNTPNVILCFQEANAKLVLPEVMAEPNSQACLRSKPVQLIEETSTSIFIADPNDGGPEAWRVGTKPQVIEIRRDRIASISYLPK